MNAHAVLISRSVEEIEACVLPRFDGDQRTGELNSIDLSRAPRAKLILTLLHDVRDTLVLDPIFMEPVSLERKVGAVLDLGAPLVPEDDRLVLARKASSRVSVDKLVRAHLPVMNSHASK